MITFPNAKINLGLNIVEKRPDGYHNLETVFYPIPWNDALEICKVALNRSPKYNLYVSGKPIPGCNENLVVKAYNLLDNVFDLPPTDIYLYKNVPLGAGLGGGSSDAAYMLIMLNKEYNLSLSDEQLEEYAAMLGADCAFFIKNKPVYAQGIGNVFSPATISLSDYQLVIIKPDIFVSTKDAFASIVPRKPLQPVSEIIQQPVNTWKFNLVNDFEISVFKQYPQIEDIKHMFYNYGAVYSSMSGSGSSVYALFEPGFVIPEIKKEGIEYFQSTL